MTLASSSQTSEPTRRRWRWGRVVLLVLLAGLGALGWHIYTGQRAVRQLREAGFEVDAEAWLGARVWAAARADWRLVFKAGSWKSRPAKWKLDGAKAGELRNLDAVAPALRRVNPEQIAIAHCVALENVDGLKGLTGLQLLNIFDCDALQNVDGLKGLTRLQLLALCDCDALQNVDGLKGLSGLQTLALFDGAALQNVDVLKRLTGLQTLFLDGSAALQNVDLLKGLTGLQTLNLYDASKISASALRELRAALPKTDITFPDRSKLPPP